MFDKVYYEMKKGKLETKMQKLQNDTFTAFLQMAGNFFNTQNEIMAELKEIEGMTKNQLADNTPANVVIKPE